MTEKILIGCIGIIIVMGLLLKNYREDLAEAEKVNKSLTVALEGNLQATREKEKRSKDELERLQKQLEELHKITDDCLNTPVADDLIRFLQQLQRDSNSTVSFSFTK